MAFKLGERVRETSTTTGTTDFTLAGAVTGFRTFGAILSNGDTTWYMAALGAEWEMGVGTFNSGVLQRTTVLASSAGGTTKVTFSAGEKAIFCTPPAAMLAKLVDVAAVIDEDDMASDSATRPPSQQSTKAFVLANAGGPFGNALLHVADEKTSGTASKTYSTTTWNTADLNTVKTNQVSGASLSTNQITLPAGTYLIIASATLHASALTTAKARLRDVTNSATLLVGSNGKGPTNTMPKFEVCGRFTLSGSAAIELQIYPTANATGGGAASSGDAEVYAEAMIWKVA